VPATTTATAAPAATPPPAAAGTYSGADSSATGDIVLWWFKGTGGYAGLSYVMWEHLSPAEVAWSYPVEGMIFPGEPPTP